MILDTQFMGYNCENSHSPLTLIILIAFWKFQKVIFYVHQIQAVEDILYKKYERVIKEGLFRRSYTSRIPVSLQKENIKH